MLCTTQTQVTFPAHILTHYLFSNPSSGPYTSSYCWKCIAQYI